MPEEQSDFEDPLKDIDPVMEDAFSVNEEDSGSKSVAVATEDVQKKSSVDISSVFSTLCLLILAD